MTVAYRVFGNAGTGGPVDYSTVLQDSASTSFAFASIPDGDWTFGVRAYDTVSGLTEYNTDAVISVVIAGGVDRTKVPNSPIGLTVHAAGAGGATLDFAYIATGQAGAPTSFHAWFWPVGSVNWSDTPSSTLAVSFGPGDVMRFLAITLAGLTDGVTYEVGVRAVNAAGSDGNTITAPVTGNGSGPSAVIGLASAPGYAGS